MVQQNPFGETPTTVIGDRRSVLRFPDRVRVADEYLCTIGIDRTIKGFRSSAFVHHFGKIKRPSAGLHPSGGE